MPDWTNLYGVYADQNHHELVMVAPEHTIRQIFGLRKEAWDRVRNNTANGTSTKLFFNGRPVIDLEFIVVKQLELVRF